VSIFGWDLPPLKEYPLTKYIWIGDEPNINVVIVDLEQLLDAATIVSLKQTLTYLPRSELGALIDKQVKPIVSPEFFPVIKKSFIDLFNKLNVAEAINRQLEFWDWESAKMRALYESNPDKMVDKTSLAYKLSTAGSVQYLEDQTIASLKEQYASLPKLGDLGAEASRQAGIIGLLQYKEFDMVQRIINAYKNATPEETAILESPPSNLTTLAPALRANLTSEPQISNVLDQNPVTINVAAGFIPASTPYNPLLNLTRR